MSKINITTQIIGGKYRGKKIALPPVATTRSSKSRLKESFFNTIQFDIVGANFIEMFAGSGSVGLEAISRGAKRVYFFEKNELALQTLQKNITSFGRDDSLKCEVISGDSFENIYRVIERLKEKKEKAYFYIDPPFHIREGMEDIYQKIAEVINSIPKEVCEMVVIEHSSTFIFEDRIGQMKRIKSKKFGKTTLSYYQ